jgi:FAD:protein FMN transferase
VLGYFFLHHPKPVRHVQYIEGVLGTTLELWLETTRPQSSENRIVQEIQRLEQIFSRFIPDSELNRFLQTQGVRFAASPELEYVLQHALEWQRRSGGAFHIGTDALLAVWKNARNLPTTAELAPMVQALQEPWLELSASYAVRHADLPINLGGIAKGYIADVAAKKADANEVLINLGGDLVHRGQKPVVASIANPRSSADNAPPLERIQICNQGLATSGHTHRGFAVGQTRVSHLFDPRTGQPVEHVLAASVLAPDAMTADVLATVCSVLLPQQSLELLANEPHIGVCIVDNYQVHHNEFWKQHQL